MADTQSIKPTDLELTDIVTVTRGVTEFKVRFTNINTLLSDNIEAMFSNLSGDPESNLLLKAILDNIRSLITNNSNEILYLHKQLGTLIFELTNQGIEIDSEELLNEINYTT